MCLAALHCTVVVHQQCTKWHDQFIKKKVFQKVYWALLYDSRCKDFKGRLCTRWLGPYEVDTIYDNGTIKLTTIDGSQTYLFTNGHRLRLPHKPLTRDSFISHIVSYSSYHLAEGEESTPTPSTTYFVLPYLNK